MAIGSVSPTELFLQHNPQDKITAELAKSDPEALGDLQALFEKIRQDAGSVDR